MGSSRCWLAVWRALWAAVALVAGAATLVGTSRLDPPMPWVVRVAAALLAIGAALFAHLAVGHCCGARPGSPETEPGDPEPSDQLIDASGRPVASGR